MLDDAQGNTVLDVQAENEAYRRGFLDGKNAIAKAAYFRDEALRIRMQIKKREKEFKESVAKLARDAECLERSARDLEEEVPCSTVRAIEREVTR